MSDELIWTPTRITSRLREWALEVWLSCKAPEVWSWEAKRPIEGRFAFETQLLGYGVSLEGAKFNALHAVNAHDAQLALNLRTPHA
jgi:hypothetical protein